MPYTMRKVSNKPCYRVVNNKTGKVKARCSTKKNAMKQMRLLRALENNPKFRKTMRRMGGGVITFKELHSDGWEKKKYAYRFKHFKLGDVDLGKLHDSSYSGNTPELYFGDGVSYKYRVQPDRDDTLKIIDVNSGKTLGVNINNDFLPL